MGHFRFHRSIGNKFVRLNVSKTGLSLTSGVPGAHLNVPLAGRKRRMMGTLSIPGTGLSYRQTIGGTQGSSDVPVNQQILCFFVGAIVLVALWWIFS